VCISCVEVSALKCCAEDLLGNYETLEFVMNVLGPKTVQHILDSLSPTEGEWEYFSVAMKIEIARYFQSACDIYCISVSESDYIKMLMKLQKH